MHTALLKGYWRQLEFLASVCVTVSADVVFGSDMCHSVCIRQLLS